jgi:hypothetical protein
MADVCTAPHHKHYRPGFRLSFARRKTGTDLFHRVPDAFPRHSS